ncbi:ATP-binding protein [Fodinicurvata fenggangensis]|uniref:ATP-binding protein n=1 Tax=Fodinicurvata fenggangensis TaxID=1121830 RepID=UPI000690AD80|nr:ATP-binding protein [Fodinicurvata fenggangensis]
MNKELIQRWQQSCVEKRLKDRRVLLLAGARQCGKTTLARSLHGADTEYRTLDNPNICAAALEDPISFVHHDAQTLIIDEIQRAPALLSAIKLMVDQDLRPGQFLLTGSTNLSAIPQVQESLAGRIARIRLRPFTQAERIGTAPHFLHNAFNMNLPKKVPPISREQIGNLAFMGGYPEALGLDKSGRQEWHQDYIRALLDRDLADIARIHRHDAMRRLVEIVAAWSSKLLTIADIASGLSIKRPTVESYLAALEALYLVDRVPAWTKTDYERVGKQDKLFMSDSGLMASILNWRMEQVQYDADRIGKLVETFIYNELAALSDLEEDYRLYHYRDRQQHEIDFLVERQSDGALLGIEVKSSATLSKNAFKSLRWFRDNIAGERAFIGLVLYSGDQVLNFGDHLQALPHSAVWAE